VIVRTSPGPGSAIFSLPADASMFDGLARAIAISALQNLNITAAPM
jgi:hypothetical protein